MIRQARNKRCCNSLLANITKFQPFSLAHGNIEHRNCFSKKISIYLNTINTCKKKKEQKKSFKTREKPKAPFMTRRRLARQPSSSSSLSLCRGRGVLDFLQPPAPPSAGGSAGGVGGARARCSLLLVMRARARETISPDPMWLQQQPPRRRRRVTGSRASSLRRSVSRARPRTLYIYNLAKRLFTFARERARG